MGQPPFVKQSALEFFDGSGEGNDRTLSGEHLSGLMEQRRDLFCCSIRTAWRDTWKELHAEANLYHQRGGAARAERDKGLPINNAPVDRLHICRR